MMGISYGGISQLFTAADAAAEPRRDLAAVGDRRRRRRRSTRAASSTPASRSTGPRSARTRRMPAGPRRRARPWAYKRIQEGDETCKDNQALHGRGGRPAGEDPRQQPLQAEGRRPARRRSRSSTRSRCRRSWPASGTTSRPAATARRSRAHFTGTDKKWFTFTNGTHVDSLDPETFNRWYDFLQLYVAKQAPITNSARDPGRRRR